MSNDRSLSRVLGDLRIANPDDGSSSSSPPHKDSAELDQDQGRFRQAQPPLSPARPPSADAALAAASQPAFHPQSELATRPSRSHTVELRNTAAQREADPMSQLSAYAQGNISFANIASRPGSALYSAAERDQAANSYNLLRNEPSRASNYNNRAPEPRPSNAGYPAGMPTRQASRRDRAFNPTRQAPSTVERGPLPPRGSSKGMGGGYVSIPGVPTAPEPRIPFGPGVPGQNTSEEWKDRGAAVTMRKEVDMNGRMVTKPVKKGVRDFTFGHTLGEGSYSTVFFATDRQTLKEYAIKVLEKKHIIKEKKIKYVNIEKDTLNRLTEHPGIVRLYYTFQDETSLYYVLDLCNGGELLGVLKKTGTFDVDCTRFYGAQILDAIEYMHSRGVIHRDLKPENVLLDDQLHVKITDFGTARLLSDPRANQSQRDDSSVKSKDQDQDDNRATSFVGTAEYVSPELLTSKNACKASDLWAFGCIIYQLLAGRPPFKAGSEFLTFQKIVNLDYEFPAGFPPAARDLVERCLVLDPARRLTIEHIKNHQFFDGQPFGKGLWRSKAPRLRPYVPPSQEPKIIPLNGSSSTSQIPSSRPPQTGALDNSSRAPGRIITDIPPPSQLDIEWSPVLTRTNERILKLGDLLVLSSPIPNSPHSKNGDGDGHRKLARLFGGSTTKKRQRLVMVTSSGRIVLAPAGGEEKKTKHEISLLAPDCAWRTQIDAKGQTVWCVDSNGTHYTFEEPKASNSLITSRPTAEEWLEALEHAKDMAIATNLAGSYHSENFAEMSSSMSSPGSTFGLNGVYPEGYTGSQRTQLTKSQASLDDMSAAKRNRFSKRQSKQGLGSSAF